MATVNFQEVKCSDHLEDTGRGVTVYGRGCDLSLRHCKAPPDPWLQKGGKTEPIFFGSEKTQILKVITI